MRFYWFAARARRTVTSMCFWLGWIRNNRGACMSRGRGLGPRSLASAGSSRAAGGARWDATGAGRRDQHPYTTGSLCCTSTPGLTSTAPDPSGRVFSESTRHGSAVFARNGNVTVLSLGVPLPRSRLGTRRAADPQVHGNQPAEPEQARSPSHILAGSGVSPRKL